MIRAITRPQSTIALLAGLALVLTACMLSPGKFVSALDISKDGTFRFTYTGEIHMIALSDLAKSARPKFEPATCQNDESGEDRPCSKAELADQKRDWDAQQAASTEREKSERDTAKQFLGGIDPSDPKAAAELATRLRKQLGWRRVDYKGNGLYDVDVAIAGRLDHDFAFPTIERFPFANAFVQVALRGDGTARIDAPGFGPAAGGMPVQSLLQMGVASNTEGSGGKLPQAEGTFTLRTNGAILANNTDDGPQPQTSGQVLTWQVSARSAAPPMALIRLR